MITNNILPVGFVKIVGRPVSEFIINVAVTCERIDKFCTVQNGCYHMKYKDTLSMQVKILPQLKPSPALVSL